MHEKKKLDRSDKHAKTYYSTLSSKNQITVPSIIREKLHAEPGDQIMFSVDENEQLKVDIMKKESLLSLYGSMPPKGEETSKKWSDIRIQAREEMIDSKGESTNDE